MWCGYGRLEQWRRACALRGEPSDESSTVPTSAMRISDASHYHGGRPAAMIRGCSSEADVSMMMTQPIVVATARSLSAQIAPASLAPERLGRVFSAPHVLRLPCTSIAACLPRQASAQLSSKAACRSDGHSPPPSPIEAGHFVALNVPKAPIASHCERRKAPGCCIPSASLVLGQLVRRPQVESLRKAPLALLCPSPIITTTTSTSQS